MIHVFHNPKTNFFHGDPEHVFSITQKELVAEIATDDLEEAFKLTNSIDKPWYESTEPIVKYSRPSRSTSVGDFMALNGEWFMVDAVGFKKVDGSAIDKPE